MQSVMNLQALKAMAQSLPESESDMLSLPHVTKANFEKYGKELLAVTSEYASEKLSKLDIFNMLYFVLISGLII